MRTILSLGLALVLGAGAATLAGCDKKATTAKDTTEHKVITPGGGEKDTKTTTESKETPPEKK